MIRWCINKVYTYYNQTIAVTKILRIHFHFLCRNIYHLFIIKVIQSVSAIPRSAQNEVCILLWSDFTLTENKIPLKFKSSRSKHYSDLLMNYNYNRCYDNVSLIIYIWKF